MKLNTLLFFLLLVFSLLIRVWKLDQYPISLNWDEVSHGYNAYSILETSKDQWGTKYPLFNFRAYGDYPTTLNLYLTIPFVSLLGLNEWSVRLPSVLLGFLAIIPVFFLGKYIFSSSSLALLLSFIFSISPWAFFPSRAVFQSTVAQFFFISGITLILYGLKPKHILQFFLGSLSLALSTYGYHNTRLIAPLIYPILLFIKRSGIGRFHLLGIFTFLLITTPVILNLLNPESRARNQWVGIIDQGAVSYLEQQRNFYHNSLPSKIIFNRATYFTCHFFRNYASFLNPLNLFFKGTNNYQFNLPGYGVLLSLWLPLFYLGLIISAIRYPKYLLFFAISLLPSALTKGDFPVIRAMSVLPLPQIFIILGFRKVLTVFTKHSPVIIFVFISLSLLQLSFYLKNYFFNYPVEFTPSWQYGYKQVVTYIKKHYQEYDQVILTKKYGEPHEYILFFWPWPPSSYQQQVKWDYHANWYWVDAFDKFRFVNDWEIKNLPISPSTLLITSPNNYPKNLTKLATVNYPDGKPVFDILTTND